MKTYRIPFYLVTVLLMVAIALIVVQCRIIRRLHQETPLRMPKPSATDKLREENAALAEELKAIQERTDAEHRELIRLRGHVSGLRDKDQEIAQLKAERERMFQPAPPIARADVDQLTPEQIAEKRRTMARLSYSKHIGLALIMAASDEGNQLPQNLDGLEGKYLQRSPELDEHNLQMGQFELLYKGKLNEAQEPSRTVLAREREPVQRIDGSWGQVFVFLDGHAQVLSAPTREQLAQREKEQFILPKSP